MSEYSPKDSPEIVLVYDILPGQEATFDQEGIDDEVDITDIKIKFYTGSPLQSEACLQAPIQVYEACLDYWGEKWTKEILENECAL